MIDGYRVSYRVNHKGHTYGCLFMIWTHYGHNLDIFRDRYRGVHIGKASGYFNRWSIWDRHGEILRARSFLHVGAGRQIRHAGFLCVRYMEDMDLDDS